MGANDATRKPWWRKVVAGILVALGLAAIGLPNSQAQMRYSGGFIQYHRHPPGVTLAPSPSPSGITRSPSSYFPDNDFYFPGEETWPTVSPPAGDSLFGVPARVLPWNQVGFKEYPPFSVPPEWLPSLPRKYALEVTQVPLESPAARADTAMLIVHLPEPAMLWVEGRPIPLRGQTSYFRSPPLNPAKKYIYTVRAAWFEEGQWVSLTREVPVTAGLIQALYLRPVPTLQALTDPDRALSKTQALRAKDASDRPEKQKEKPKQIRKINRPIRR
jgi:uncharacterized protein (TIGR03000 family)